MSILGAASLAGGAAKTTTTTPIKAASATAVAGAASTAKPAAKPATSTATSASSGNVVKAGPSIGTTVHHNSSSKSWNSTSSTQPAVNKTISDAGKAATNAAAPAATKTSSGGNLPASSAAGAAAGAIAAYTASPPLTANAGVAVVALPAAPTAAGPVVATGLGAFLGLGALAGAFVLAGTDPAGGDSEREFEALVNANLAAHGLHSEQTPDPDEPVEGTVPATGKPEKQVPNPWGKLGGPAHRAGVAAAEERMKAKYADDPEVLVGTEIRVDTPNGEKKSRYLDVGVTRGEQDELIEGVQVGRITATGLIPSRERKAISDVLGAKAGATVGYDVYTERKK